MGKVFLTADLHFGHANIIKYESRPYADVEAMDKAIIANWNKAVDKGDTVFIVGDFSFHDKKKTADIIQKLNGKKILIKGNHDKYSSSWYIGAGFHEATKYPIIYKKWYIISHEPPCYFNDASPYFYIYGHVHSTRMYPTVTTNAACVSIERWDYAPVEFDLIKKLSGAAAAPSLAMPSDDNEAGGNPDK